MKPLRLPAAVYAAILLASPLVSADNAVLYWNQQAIDATRLARNPHLARLDEAGLGELLMHFMLETIIAAHLLGVDAFDQPAVEEGKVLAKKYLTQ